MNVSPEAQRLVLQIQNLQQQAQLVVAQKESLNAQREEVKRALEELGKSGDEVYKAVGPVLVRTEKKKLETELRERLETIELRLKTFGSQEEKILRNLKEKQQKLESIIRGGGEK